MGSGLDVERRISKDKHAFPAWVTRWMQRLLSEIGNNVETFETTMD